VGESFEALLLKRVKSAGFVPGAWVFPGGRVDSADGDASLASRLGGVTLESAAERLSLPIAAQPSALAYYIAAIREAFEETGILVGLSVETGRVAPTAAEDSRVQELRLRLMDDDGAFAAVLDEMRCRMDGEFVEYVAHWITPEAEPRRFDTRFFAAIVQMGAEPLVDPRESTEAAWFTPKRALEENLAGRLPMVFPTIHTLRSLAEFPTVVDALAHYRARAIPVILPRIVRTADGVAIRADDPGL
jgi:8-oxo-dGTP pyrophosphatase MutT (NUDIX family)